MIQRKASLKRGKPPARRCVCGHAKSKHRIGTKGAEWCVSGYRPATPPAMEPDGCDCEKYRPKPLPKATKPIRAKKKDPAESQRELERLMARVCAVARFGNVKRGASMVDLLRQDLAELLEKLARTEAEVDRLDGIRGDLVATFAVVWQERDEARRLAEEWREATMRRAIRGEGGPALITALPWELGAPAAGREEGKT